MKIRKRSINEDKIAKEIERLKKSLRKPSVRPSQTHKNRRRDKKIRRREKFD